MKSVLRRLTVPVFVLGLFLSACVVQRSPVTGEKRAYGYSWEQEKQIGKEADQQVQQQYGVYDDQNLQSYVNNVAQSVLSVSHMRRPDTPQKYKDTKFHFRVLDSDIVNAFALPGGYIYVTRGLLSHLENEAQLAVVLGHEIGHVAARHASQRAFEQQVGQIALIGGAVAGQELLGIPGQNILNLGGQAAQFLFLKYSRDDEREADRLGVEYASMEHYKSSEAAGFFDALRRMSQQSGQSIPDWQSTHPDPSERANTIPKLAEKWREKGYKENKVDADKYMGEIDNMVYGPNPREGFSRNGVFYHPELAFQFPYPEGWQLINQRSAVVVTNKGQDAIALMEIDSKSESPKASVDAFLNQDGINTLQSQASSHNGLQGYEATATAQTKEGQQLKVYLYSVKYNSTIYRFVTYTLAEKFDSYFSKFQAITQGFRPLTDRSILNIQPVRLKVIKTNRKGTLQSFLPDSYNATFKITAEDIAILNQRKLDEVIPAGTWIKIPRH